jgi:hypothetical protein
VDDRVSTFGFVKLGRKFLATLDTRAKGRCVECGLPVMGCPEDDDCPANRLCAAHYFAKADREGRLEVVGFGDE